MKSAAKLQRKKEITQRARARGYLWSLIFLPGDPRDEREEETICAGGRNSEGNEQLRKEEEEEEEKKEDRGTMRGSHLC